MNRQTGEISGREAVHTGVPPAAAPAVAERLIRGENADVSFLICPDSSTAEKILHAVEGFLAAAKSDPPPHALLLPSPGEGEETHESEGERLHVFNLLRGAGEAGAGPGPLLVVTTPDALLADAPDPALLRQEEILLCAGQETSFEGLVQHLVKLDYDSESLCESPGQYAVRGGIIDVYPFAADTPYRIDFFGDTIEEIRVFDPTGQRSDKAVESVLIPPSARLTLAAAQGGIEDYLGLSVCWVLLYAESWPDASPLPPETRTFRTLCRKRRTFPDVWHALSELDTAPAFFAPDAARNDWRIEPLETYRPIRRNETFSEDSKAGEEEARKAFFHQLLEWRKEGFHVTVFTHNEGEETRLKEILEEHGRLKELNPDFRRGVVHEGFLLRNPPGEDALGWKGAPSDVAGVVVVSDSEIFGRYRQHRGRRRTRKRVVRAQVDRLLDFSELVEGDLLVHLQHGICRFRGINPIESRTKGESAREMISVEFADAITLHVPFSESHLLTRYVGFSKTAPPLGRIGSGQWEKTRRAAEKAALDFAAKLLHTQAMRESREGTAFPPDDVWQHEFEAAFLHTETPDQLRAAAECKADMEKTKPMDRLLCGDVGFGKTEVALRAIFKAVTAGKQAAVLVPTTILAQQHFQTFSERMADYPIVVETISRFRSRRDQTALLKALAAGKIDVLIGTHRLLGRDVAFRELGLIVIDEEHRFGLKQKEALKHLRETADILSMSATPIPRTLHLALSGARDLSVIETPPVDRLPIKTYVKNYDPQLVVEAVRRELKRGGQVFYLHNQVATIDSVAARLAELLPEARIATGHGQMTEKRLERVMGDFASGRYDVLISTTIIESGLDIPNCNTLIVEAADRFGLSQLYQLRGRIGRFKHQAHAYLLLHRHGRVHEIARKRLAAIRRHNRLGAGFQIAMRDLEIRGAGNLLGAKQSGHIAGVGFDLYCRLLRQSIARLKGDAEAAAVRAAVRIDFVNTPGKEAPRDAYAVLKESELARGNCPQIEARLPETYIGETRLRLDLYRRLAMAATPGEVEDLHKESRDRFGPLPEPAEALFKTAEIRCLAEQKGIIEVATEGNRLKCRRHTPDRNGDYLRVGARFPRLTQIEPMLRLKEIADFLKRIQNRNHVLL